MTRFSVQPGGVAATAASALLRAAAAVIAGAALTIGLALVLWSVTPGAGSEPAVAVEAGAVAFAAAHFLPVAITGTAVTLAPLLLTAVMVAIIMTAVGRARPVHGRMLEALHACVFVVAYGLGVDVLVAIAMPTGVANAGLGAPFAVAALAAGLSLAHRTTAWHIWWEATSPLWVRQAVQAAVATVFALVSVAAVVLSVALAASMPDALRIAQLTVHSVGDVLGMTVLSLAFVPNAVIAAVGYVSGAGFSLGAATYSPLAVHAADLPAVPLLAAVPPDGAPGVAAWATLAAPVVAALVGAWVLRRVGESRWQRLAACGLTALLVGVVTTALVAVGGGGVAGGSWAAMGAAPLIVGPLVAGVVLLVTTAATVPVGWRALAWRSVPTSAGYDAVPDEASAEGENVAVPDEASAEGENVVIPETDADHDSQPDDPLTATATDTDAGRDVGMDAGTADCTAVDAVKTTDGASDGDNEGGFAQAG